ncbi:SDR family oxidoreductase [Anaerovorax odorimutans]|uniref:SDR family oxidoreductase n=1 Tax=Anaerovorax odorimutans TaxID=109327 RepID=A0ABT1RUK6_9FIRM|nr:SDR family NAD(P)-dependent oxidoreductase [Anaerovorax odorimutans]MCQ4638546.1 SDR family oxidoreductase [Anaerovorax odorimutans]
MVQSFINFENQVCLVTGAGSPTGIGFSTARILGGLGGRIALVATTERIYDRVKELEEMGIAAKGYIADLMDRRQTAAMVDQVIKDFGCLHVLVNNAGMVQVGQAEEDFSDMMNLTYESWDTSINRNLNICFNVTKEVLPHLVKANYGRIVNVSSVTGPVVSNPGEAAYSAAKAGIVGMSRALAIEAGVHNITVNNVLPGWIGTASQTEEEAVGGLNTPMKRSASPEEVANAIVFLASKEASYITGESLIVDGGNTLQEYKGPSDLYY